MKRFMKLWPPNDGFPKLVPAIVFYLSPLDINSQKEMLVVGILRVNHHLNYSAQLLPVFKKKIAKGTTDLRVEFISQVITQILIKNFD